MADIRTRKGSNAGPGPEEGLRREVYRGDRTLVPEVPAIAWVSASRATQLVSPHAHADLFEISYFTRGAADWWVEQNLYRVTAGQVFITKPGELHGARDEMLHPHEHWQIQLRLPLPPSAEEAEVVPTSEPPLAVFAPGTIDRLTGELAAIRRHCFPGSREIEHHMSRILLEHRHPGEFSPLVIRAAMCELIVTVIRDEMRAGDPTGAGHPSSLATANGRGGDGGRTRDRRRLEPVLAWIDGNLDEIRSAQQIAGVAGLSLRQFYRLFQQELSVTPNEYLVERRIETAKRLLMNDRLSITDVAFRVGFSSSQYFSTVFKEQTGVTPTRFRTSRPSGPPGTPGTPGSPGSPESPPNPGSPEPQ